MTSWLYLIVNLGTILIPLIFSFHPKLKFHKEWKRAWLAILIVAIPFIIWDIYYTAIGVWGFNDNYLLGLNLFGLPLEEVLFFICIPYACLYTYHCFSILIKECKYSSNLRRVITAILTIVIIVLFVQSIFLLYSTITLAGLLMLFIGFLIFNPIWLPRLYLTLLILILPFLFVNGILTGSGIENEVVWYSPNEFSGIRILTIPIEDFGYGSLLICLNVLIYNFLKRK